MSLAGRTLWEVLQIRKNAIHKTSQLRVTYTRGECVGEIAIRITQQELISEQKTGSFLSLPHWQAQVGFSVRISLKSTVRISPFEVWVRRRTYHVGTWVRPIQARRAQSALPRRCKLWSSLPRTHFLKLARGRGNGYLACLPAPVQGAVTGVVLLTHLYHLCLNWKQPFWRKLRPGGTSGQVAQASYEWTITCHETVDENQWKEPGELMELLIQGCKENNSRDKWKLNKKHWNIFRERQAIIH